MPANPQIQTATDATAVIATPKTQARPFKSNANVIPISECLIMPSKSLNRRIDKVITVAP
jgi:hypothetical protein